MWTTTIVRSELDPWYQAGKNINVDVNAEGDGVPSRSDRLRDREDLRVDDLAKERAYAKHKYGYFADSNKLHHT